MEKLNQEEISQVFVSNPSYLGIFRKGKNDNTEYCINRDKKIFQ
jgi:hypothetical protein